MKIFTSDLHHMHSRICELTNRSKDTTQENHTKWLIDVWNKNVTPADICYVLGDYSFAKKYNDIAKFTERLNGTKILIKGNHDKREYLDQLVRDRLITAWYDYKEIKIGETSVCLFHFPVSSWHKQGYGSWHLHGHCFDYSTEVLTECGFKQCNDITKRDKIATVNMDTGLLQYQEYSLKHEYEGLYDMYSFNGKSLNFNITDGHRFLYSKHKNTKLMIDKIKDVRGNIAVPLNCTNNKVDYPIGDDQLRLYLHITTDGSFENNDLVRFHFRKERKISELRKLLTRLNIPFSDNLQKSGTTKINFHLPEFLKGFKIKPLDRELCLKLSLRQVKILVDTYEITDGCKSGKNSWQFATSKECEANLLQEVLVTSGYCCNLLKRQVGKYTGYVLSVNTRQQSHVHASKFLKVTDVVKVWCLSVPNGTLIVRRNGKVHVTGNCHGNHADSKGKMLDVGIDSAYNIYKEHKFFTEEDIAVCMQDRSVYVSDHHKEYK